MVSRIEIPDGFPDRLTDGQLSEFVDEWIRNYTHLYGDPSAHLPELKLGFIRLALEEQTRREIAASARSAAAAASKVVVIAVLTLGVAVTTLIVAIAK